VLRRLTDLRLLKPLERRVGGVRAGSDGYVLTLTLAGQRLVGEGRPMERRPPSERFVKHTLASADIYMRLQLVERAERCSLMTLAVEGAARQRFASLSGQQELAPDLFVHLRTGQDELAWWIEVDLATEHVGTLVTKAERYLAAYRSGLAIGGDLFPRVLWLVPSDRRRAEVRSALDKVRRPVTGLFVIARFEEFEPVVLGETESEAL
jgi:hypothetical protein